MAPVGPPPAPDPAPALLPTDPDDVVVTAAFWIRETRTLKHLGLVHVACSELAAVEPALAHAAAEQGGNAVVGLEVWVDAGERPATWRGVGRVLLVERL